MSEQIPNPDWNKFEAEDPFNNNELEGHRKVEAILGGSMNEFMFVWLRYSGQK